MEKFEPQQYKKEKEVAKEIAKPPRNLPVEDVEIEIDLKEYARTLAREIGLEDRLEVNFFVNVFEREEKCFKDKDTESEAFIFKWARQMIGKTGEFREPMELFEYYGSYPDMRSDSRKEFKKLAEKARSLLEERRDISLPPFDEKAKLQKLREQRKKTVEMVRSGEITREIGLMTSRDDFEEFKKEREWQRNGMEYLKTKIMEDMFSEMKTSAGVSALEGRMILENEQELKEFIEKNGSDSAIKLLEVPVGSFDEDENRAYFLRKIGETIREKAKFYRFTDEQIAGLEVNILHTLVAKRVEMVEKIKKYPDSFELFRGELELYGADKYRNSIIATPFVFYARIGNLDDYTSLYKRKRRGLLSVDEIKEADQSGGFHHEANYLVEKNIPIKAFDAKKFRIFVHEEEHFFDRIFQERTMYWDLANYLDGVVAYLAHEEIKTGKKDFEKTKYEIKCALRGFRGYYEWCGASEFLAYFRDGANLEWVYDTLTKEKKQGGIYDYFNEETREKISKYIIENFDGMSEGETRRIINQVLVEEYERILDAATKAIRLLTNVKFTISKDHIINFLQKLPLHKWLPETRKFLKKKKEKDI